MKNIDYNFNRSMESKSIKIGILFWIIIFMFVILIILGFFILKFNIIISSNGFIKYNREFEITTKVDGFVKKVNVKDFDTVKANESIIFELENSDLINRLDLKRDELKIIEYEFKKHENSYYTSKIDIEKTKQRIKSIENEIKYLEDKVNSLKINSPINGTIIGYQLEKQKGKYVPVGATLCRVVDLNSLYAQALISGTQIHRIKTGQKARIKITAIDYYVFDGYVSKIYNEEIIDNTESYYSVDIKFNKKLNPKIFKSGMGVDVKVITNEMTIFKIFIEFLKKAKYKAENLFA